MKKETIIFSLIALITTLVVGYDMLYTVNHSIINFIFENVWLLFGIFIFLIIYTKIKEKQNLGKFTWNTINFQTAFAFLLMNVLDIMTTIIFMNKLGIDIEINIFLKWALHQFGYHPIVFFVDCLLTTAVLLIAYKILPSKIKNVYKWTIILTKAYIVMHNLLFLNYY